MNHGSPMHTEKSQLGSDEQIMPKMMFTFTEFPALSVDPRVKISRSAPETDDLLLSLPVIRTIVFL